MYIAPTGIHELYGFIPCNDTDMSVFNGFNIVWVAIDALVFVRPALDGLNNVWVDSGKAADSLLLLLMYMLDTDVDLPQICGLPGGSSVLADIHGFIC